ncbi:MAG: hypothetical protein V4617_07665 [Gemmatimonadota bacterium]
MSLLARVAREAQRIGAAHGETMWPGFRPDTIPFSFVLPARGDVLFGWHGALPAGYVAMAELPGAAWREGRAMSAASTSTTVDGRGVGQVLVSTLDPAILVGTALHEAFHVFMFASQQPGRKFGRGENSLLISTYPVFDVENEAAFALEGKILANALAATSIERKRVLAQQFVAVRRERHRRLPLEFAEFEVMSELNEGLAEYVLVRALMIQSNEAPVDWRPMATRALANARTLLERLTASENLSLRFRFYQTGPAQALLVDALGSKRWKQDMLDANSTLQDVLGAASGVDAVAIAARRTAQSEPVMTALRRNADGDVEQLKASRRAKVDSVLSAPGTRLVIRADSLPVKAFNSCGYDPQNLLQVSATVRIQTRWWKPCAGGPTYAEFNVPSVHDAAAGTISAVIGDDGAVKLTSNGQPLAVGDGETLRDVRAFKLHAPRASVDAVRADITRRGSVLTVIPKAP